MDFLSAGSVRNPRLNLCGPALVASLALKMDYEQTNQDNSRTIRAHGQPPLCVQLSLHTMEGAEWETLGADGG